jgi:hypothetical protein
LSTEENTTPEKTISKTGHAGEDRNTEQKVSSADLNGRKLNSTGTHGKKQHWHVDQKSLPDLEKAQPELGFSIKIKQQPIYGGHRPSSLPHLIIKIKTRS